MNLKECYLAAGADYEDMIRRFINEERADRFLALFLKDQSFNELCGAMDEERYEDAFRAVHTIKGICMNLGLTALSSSCVDLTENLRQRRLDGDTQRFFEQVKKDFERTASAINQHFRPGE